MKTEETCIVVGAPVDWPAWRPGHEWPSEELPRQAYLVTLMDEDNEPFVDIADYIGGGRWRLTGESWLVHPYTWMPLPPAALGSKETG